MKFEWDETKNQANKRKHKISFELACKVFDDPNHRTEFDRDINGEERWHALGLVYNLVIIMVVHTFRRNGEEEIIRIISARKADARERRQYEEQL